LCEDGTTDFLCPWNEGLDRTSRSCIHQFSQDTTSIHWSRRSSQSRGTTTTIHTSLPSNASDGFAFKSSLHKIGCLRIRNLVKTVIHQCLICYKFKAQATQQLIGELPPSRVQPSRPFLTTGVDCWTHLTTIGNYMQQNNNKGLHCYFCLLCDKGRTHWGCHKPNYRSIPCCPKSFHSMSRETKNNLLRQWYQLSRCCKSTSWRLQNASLLITDG
jgi:hypothetical protein